ncbi:MAG: HAMP domain-containing histidine kinase [Deltaproteobacteria bacterium]|nr:HAMP domain-containing histidine kinase [Deltaproteobacteria bacterium]
MSRRSTSIAARAAWAAFASAGFAAAVAAISAIAISDWLVLRQTDRHLSAAATELAREVDAAKEPRDVARAVSDEQQEATTAGIRLAVYGGAGELVAGDATLKPIAETCATQQDLRICSARGAAGQRILAGTLRDTAHGLLAASAAAAAALAGVVAWLVGRTLSRRAVAPLVRLQTRIANVPLDGAPQSRVGIEGLGDDEGVLEVDELRAALVTLLERMHDAIDRSALFAANAAHELRTPLASLRAELELMAEAERTTGASELSTQRKSLDVALRKVDQLQAVTERLLALATPDDGQDGFAVLSTRDLVDEAVAGLDLAERQRVAALADDDDADHLIRGDAEALRIAVSNGLSNALKFGTRATIEVVAGESEAVIAIEDDGPGVPEDERMKVFEPFIRGGTSRGLPGTGLGLALVAHVSKRHRGRACLTAPRHGTTGARLEIHLPLATDEPPRAHRD